MKAEEFSGRLWEFAARVGKVVDALPDTRLGRHVANHQFPVINLVGFQGLDHLALAVPDTKLARKLWRDTFGFPVLYSEDVNGGSVRLTHLDLGNTHLQLVQPLTPDHPLQAWLAKYGPGLHHFCFRVEDVAAAPAASPVPTAPNLHQGTEGKRALLLDKAATQGVQVELTGK